MSTFDPSTTRRGAGGTDTESPGSVVVGEQLAAAVDQAVLARVQQEAAAMAEDAFEEILTPELSVALQERARTVAAALLEAEGQAGDVAAEGPRFANVGEWVEQFFSTMIVRWPSQDFLWCPQWWSHGEVVSRLTGLWITWEKARLGDAADINTWWLQQLDPHLSVITAQGGPLTGCNQNDGHGGERAGLLVTPPHRERSAPPRPRRRRDQPPRPALPGWFPSSGPDAVTAHWHPGSLPRAARALPVWRPTPARR